MPSKTKDTAPVRRGRRIALPPAAPPPPASTVYVVNGRDLRYHGRLVPAGVEIPDAASWFRLSAWIDARRIRPVAPGEDYTPYEEWVAPILEAEEAARAALEAAEQAAAEQAKAETEKDADEAQDDADEAETGDSEEEPDQED